MDGIGREFLEKTRYRHLPASAQERGQPQPPLEARLGDGEIVELPRHASTADGPTLWSVIEGRRSLREYAATSLSLEELASLLWSTQGVSRVVPGRTTFRTIPSAGARHAFETVVVHRVAGIDPGT